MKYFYSLVILLALIYPISASIVVNIEPGLFVKTLADASILVLLGSVIQTIIPSLSTLALMIFIYYQLTDDNVWVANFVLILIWLIVLRIDGYKNTEEFFQSFYDPSTYSLFKDFGIKTIVCIIAITLIMKYYDAIGNYFR